MSIQIALLRPSRKILAFLNVCNLSSDLMGSRCYIQLDILQQLELKKRTLTTFKSCDLRLGFSSTWKQQLSNIKLVKEIKEKD